MDTDSVSLVVNVSLYHPKTAYLSYAGVSCMPSMQGVSRRWPDTILADTATGATADTGCITASGATVELDRSPDIECDGGDGRDTND